MNRQIIWGTRIVAALLGSAAIVGCAAFDTAFDLTRGDAFSGSAGQFAARMQVQSALPFVLYGYGGDPEFGYEDGVGTVWEHSRDDGEERFRIERALLRTNPDGTQWWFVRFGEHADDRAVVMEVLVNERFDALEAYLQDPESGEVSHIVFDEPETPDESERPDAATSDDDLRTGRSVDLAETPPDDVEVTRERTNITVPAGTFSAELTRIEPQDDSATIAEIWTSDEVPGRLVRQRTVDGDSEWVGELVEIRSDYTSTLGAF